MMMKKKNKTQAVPMSHFHPTSNAGYIHNTYIGRQPQLAGHSFGHHHHFLNQQQRKNRLHSFNSVVCSCCVCVCVCFCFCFCFWSVQLLRLLAAAVDFAFLSFALTSSHNFAWEKVWLQRGIICVRIPFRLIESSLFLPFA